ncbi:MAG: hypothetical protein AABY84_00405 [Candidatus Firestonebacteria bacterium]
MKLNKFSERFKIINTFIMIPLGAIIIYRASKVNTSILVPIVGMLFIGFGIYRANFIFKYLKSQKLQK